jgi:hypothetical protein
MTDRATKAAISDLKRRGIQLSMFDNVEDGVPVKVSLASLRQRFHGCTPEYITNVCHASCCRSSTEPTGVSITVGPEEKKARQAIRDRGGDVVNNLVVPRPGEKRCPNQDVSGLCLAHGTKGKPFGCYASPFTLTSNGGTVVVRNRYRLLKCYRDDRDGPAPPAYIAFRSALDTIFGKAEAERLCAIAANPDMTTPVAATMPVVSYLRLRGNTHTRKDGPAMITLTPVAT